MPGLIECVPNFSEGRRPEVVDEIVRAVGQIDGVTVLDHSRDATHNRSVVTFAGSAEPVVRAATAAVGRALEYAHERGILHRNITPGHILINDSLSVINSPGSAGAACGVMNTGGNACLPGIEQLSLTLSGPIDAFSGLSAADLTPTVDAGGLAPGSYSLTPIVPGLPEGVELIGITPGTVPVTIVAPATPAPTPAP